MRIGRLLIAWETREMRLINEVDDLAFIIPENLSPKIVRIKVLRNISKRHPRWFPRNAFRGSGVTGTASLVWCKNFVEENWE